MPTGYTNCVDEGCDLKTYLRSCARAFFREGDGEPQENPYYAEEVARCEAELAKLENGDASELYEAWFTEQTKWCAKQLKYNRLVRQRYDAMHATVENWKAGPDLGSLKALALAQLRIGKESDMSSYYQPPEREPCVAWHIRELAEAKRLLDRAKQKHIKHLEQITEAKKFMQALEDSFT